MNTPQHGISAPLKLGWSHIPHEPNSSLQLFWEIKKENPNSKYSTIKWSELVDYSICFLDFGTEALY